MGDLSAGIIGTVCATICFIAGFYLGKERGAMKRPNVSKPVITEHPQGHVPWPFNNSPGLRGGHIQEGTIKRGGLKPATNTPRPDWTPEPLFPSNMDLESMRRQP